MGTSNSYWGPANSTPLVPNWLDDGAGDNDGNDSSDGAGNEGNDNQDGENASPATPNPTLVATPSRFRGARTNFTRYINSGGTDRRALGRAISSYISHATGGSANAAKRIGASRHVTSGLVNFLSTAQTSGVQVALSSNNLGALVGKPIDEIFIGIMELMCPDGGSIDEGIARNAFVETIAQLVSEGMESLDGLSKEQFQHVIEVFVANAIEGRLYNDIGTKVVVEASDVHTAEFIQSQVHDFIKGSVTDAIERHSSEFDNLAGLDANELVDTIYNDVYTILETLSENESNQ